MFDKVDIKILKILQQNARTPNAEIARQIGMAPSAVLERIRKLEERGVIEGYEVRLNSRALALGLTAFIFVQTNDPYGTMKSAKLLTEVPEVVEVHHIAGEDCYLVKIRTKDTESLGTLLRNEFGKIKEISSTRTTIVMNTLKETTALPLFSSKEEGPCD